MLEMERRRRALGLRRPGSTPEKKNSKQSKPSFTSVELSKPSAEDKVITRGKTSQKSQCNGSVTPKQKTPVSHSKVTPLKPESPCSPMQSPCSLMLFPGALASPEIEVSWDWSCSQVPQDMLPPKRVKRVQDMKKQLPVLPTINIRPRPRPPVQRQITEEENQQRLEYYKNILSLNLPESNSEGLTDSTNNNVEDLCSEVAKSCTTPKRPNTRSSSASKKKDEGGSLFDDSVNEFMFECSQAIEEKLQSGEIDMGPIVDLKIPQAKRFHSPGVGSAKLYKKICHGRVNLFPENSNVKINFPDDNVDNKDNIKSRLHQEAAVSDNEIHNLDLSEEMTEENCILKDGSKFKDATLNDHVISKLSGGKSSLNQNVLDVHKLTNGINSSIQTNNSVQKPFNSNCQNVERRPLLTKPVQSTLHPKDNELWTTSHSVKTNRFQKSVNITNYNSTDKFYKSQNNNDILSNKNNSLTKPQNTNNIIVKNQDIKRRDCHTTNQMREMQRPNRCTVQDNFSADITSLLDDEFDMELSCLDVDSLCRSSDNLTQIECETSTSSKSCTQQEIEAKRLAALQKLMMKKKR